MIYEQHQQFIKMLKNLSGILDKTQTWAVEKKIDPNYLLAARLAPDQFNFTRQVQIACDTAKTFVARLTDKEAPKHEDKEATIAELQQRIQKTIDFLATVRPEDFKGFEDRRTTNPRREGKYLPGNEFFLQHAVPNFYFHITTTYSILRHNGLGIGKADYLGEIRWRDL